MLKCKAELVLKLVTNVEPEFEKPNAQDKKPTIKKVKNSKTNKKTGILFIKGTNPQTYKIKKTQKKKSITSLPYKKDKLLKEKAKRIEKPILKDKKNQVTPF